MMSTNLPLSPKKVIIGVLFFTVFWFFTVISSSWGEDKVLNRTFEKIDANTDYVLQYDGLVQKGTLGSFYHCLKNYKSISNLNAGEGDIVHAKLVVSDFSYFELSVINGEAFRFFINYAEEGLEAQAEKVFHKLVHSKSYAINCDLGLLGKKHEAD